MAVLFNKRERVGPAASKPDSVTMRGFGGGLNAVDDDLSMAPKFQVELDNFYRTSSASQAVRWGSQFWKDIAGTRNSPIVDGTYFNARNVVVTESGNILTIDSAGTVTEIWNTAIAALLPGAPAAWAAGVTQVTFVPFKDNLVIHNGTDKPVEITSAFVVKYLQDQATGSNVNVPIGKYGCVAANYHCVAGITGSPTEIIISAKGTSGTFPGDPDPNDSISIDVGAYAPEGGAQIRGISGFRTFLFVHMQSITIQIGLGNYAEDVHVPEFPDTFPQFGLLGQRCITTVVNDHFAGGVIGMANLRRNAYTPGAVDADYISEIVGPVYKSLVGSLTDAQMLRDCFVVHDSNSSNLMLFVTGGNVIVYTYNEKLKYKAWSTFSGLNWRCAWRSLLGRVFMADGTRIFQQGNHTYPGEDYRADRMLDRDMNWTTATAFSADDLVYDTVGGLSYTCVVPHVSGAGTFAADRADNPTFWELYDGIPIEFAFELPWIDGKDPMKTKKIQAVSIGTKGSGQFTLEAYVDNLYKDEDGTVIYDPSAEMVFIGNDAAGYGTDADPYGGGRRSRSPLLYNFPLKFKTVKFRIVGSTVRKLEVANFSFIFARGNFWR
jgi:hypothetical protein